MPLELPAKIPVKELQDVNPEYDGEKLEQCEALYFGGAKFRDKLGEFLVKRKIEESDKKHYEMRKKRSFYVPYSAGLLDWIAAAAFKEGVTLRADGPQEAVDYYESLNEDADGRGTPLCTVAINSLLHTMLLGRGYLFPDFRFPELIPAKRETGDARIVLMDSKTIDDWDADQEGFLRWVRMHVLEKVRSEETPWKKPDEERHVWTFFDEARITLFEATKRRNSFIEKDAKQAEARPHGLGVCPIFEIRAPKNLWVMDRILDVAIALFNREASLTWALDMSAYATLLLILESTQVNQIVSTELAALRLRPGESASYIAPPGGIYEPLFKDADRLKASLYEVVRSLGIDAAAIPQAGRMSGETVGKMREPLDILLESFTQPVLEALARVLDVIRIKRRDEDIELELIAGESEEGVQDGEEGAEPEPEERRRNESDATDKGDGGEGSGGSFRDSHTTEDRAGLTTRPNRSR